MKYLIYFIIIISQTKNKSQAQINFKVKLENFSTVNDTLRQKMFNAALLFQHVMNDTFFTKELLVKEFHFDMPNDTNRNLTTAQIVNKLYLAKEWYKDSYDSIATIYWYSTKRWNKPLGTSTIGFSNANSKNINTYLYYLRSATISEIAGHLAHEWSHKLGFQHKKKDHPQREQTVPYLFGNLVKVYASKHLSSINH